MIVIGLTFALAIIIIIGTDIYLAATKGFSATLSWWFYMHAIQYPILPAALGFVFGLLMGHLTWSQCVDVTVPCPHDTPIGVIK